MSQACHCTVGYFKRYDGPLQKIDGLPHYKDLRSTYLKDYEKKAAADINRQPDAGKLMETLKKAKHTAALPLGYKTSYGNEFTSKQPQPDHKDE